MMEPLKPHANLADRRSLVFATDVPFWRRQTGAQQRIMSLIQHFSKLGWPVSVCFLGSLTGEDRNLSHSLSPNSERERPGFEIVSLIDEWQPSGLWDKLVWQVKCLFNWFHPFVGQRSHSNKTYNSPKAASSKRLSDFESPLFRQRFENFIQRVKPDIVIVEYLALSYLVPPRSERGGIRYWVDTHDILSSRNHQFKELGLSHWIEISESEERAALNRFDGIIAIQHQEASQFQRLMEHDQPIVVAGYSASNFATEHNTAAPRHGDTIPSGNSPLAHLKEVSVGIIASNNGVNEKGIRWFLSEVWPAIEKQSDPSLVIKLKMAGSICDAIIEYPLPQSVKCLGLVESLEDFYNQVQIVVNPIQHGTGLKIKSVEAICFGKPLVTSKHGIVGLELTDSHRTSLPWIAVESGEEMAASIVLLAQDPALRERLTHAAQSYTQTWLAPDVVYRDLIEQLR